MNGALSAAPVAGEFVQLLRNGTLLNTSVSVTGTAWTFTEPAALAVGSHAYSARVADAAGNLGALSTPWSVIVNTTVPSATISAVVNDNVTPNAAIAAGAFTNDSTPRLTGKTGAALLPGQVVNVLRDGVVLSGSAAVSGNDWTYNDPGAANGTHNYTARVAQGSLVGTASAGYAITVDTVAPDVTVTLTDILGNKLSVPDGTATDDTTPTVTGGLRGTPGAGEFVQVLRNGTALSGAAVVSGTNWSFTEPTALAEATYVYSARVVDAAGNAGLASSNRSVIVNTTVPGVLILSALDDNGTLIPNGGSTADESPLLSGLLTRELLPGQSLVIYRNEAALLRGTLLVIGPLWTFAAPNSDNGSFTYTARVVQGSLAGVLSPGYLIVVR